MSRAKWPKEWPGFRSTNPFYYDAIVEGVGWSDSGLDTNYIDFRLVDGRKGYGGNGFDGLQPQCLKPLTPAARAMLAIAKERR